jgi:hypothetical protein
MIEWVSVKMIDRVRKWLSDWLSKEKGLEGKFWLSECSIKKVSKIDWLIDWRCKRVKTESKGKER